MVSCCRARRRRRTAHRARRPTHSCQCLVSQCSWCSQCSCRACSDPEPGPRPWSGSATTAPRAMRISMPSATSMSKRVVLELGDDAVDARRRHDLVADLGLANQRLLLANPLLLRTDQEGVHEPKGDGKKKKCAHGEGSREFGDGALSRLVRGSTSITSPEQASAVPGGPHVSSEGLERALLDRGPHAVDEAQQPADVVQGEQASGGRLIGREQVAYVSPGVARRDRAR